jgi:hypothetical protein
MKGTKESRARVASKEASGIPVMYAAMRVGSVKISQGALSNIGDYLSSLIYEAEVFEEFCETLVESSAIACGVHHDKKHFDTYVSRRICASF